MSHDVEPCHCEEAIKNLWLYLDSEIEAVLVERIKAHIQTCQTCRQELAWEERVRSLLRRSCTEQAPEELRVQIRHRITVIRSAESS